MWPESRHAVASPREAVRAADRRRGNRSLASVLGLEIVRRRRQRSQQPGLSYRSVAADGWPLQPLGSAPAVGHANGTVAACRRTTWNDYSAACGANGASPEMRSVMRYA